MEVFTIINNVVIKIHVGVNVKNLLTEVNAKNNLFGILVTVIVNVTNHVMLENILTTNIVNAKKNS